MLILFGLLSLLVSPSLQHGRLIQPPSRSTAWRYGFDTPPNYTDNELNCGGMNHQWGPNEGKCGECGDAWDIPLGQRPNQVGGQYATGTIVAAYTEGQLIDVSVEITAMHQGWYEFRLCAVNDPKVPVTWQCLNETLLQFVDGTTRYYIGDELTGIYDFQLWLPYGTVCSQCVLQWMWHCGNRYGTCDDNTSEVGCGPQEQFYGCADITIHPYDGEPPASTTPRTTQSTTESTAFTGSTTTQTTTTTTTPPEGSDCIWIGGEGNGSDEWCRDNCFNNPSYCPSDLCDCAVPQS